jgi:lipopolysaccharide transport system permease protein
MPESIEYKIEPSAGKFHWKELWLYRELFFFFTWRDVKVKYKQTALGVLWVVLQPLFSVAVFSLFFGRALQVPSEGLPYPVFVFSGLLLWSFFSSSVSNSGNSMLSQAAIIKKIYFPRLIIPISTVLVSFLDLLIAFVIFTFTIAFYQVHVDVIKLIFFWPIALFSTVIGTVGISCWLAALNVKYRDIRYVIPFGLQLFLFLTPVIYPTSILNYPWLKYLLALNPMSGAITLFRLPLMASQEPPEFIIISMISSIVFFAIGIFYFKRTEDFFADIA